MNEQWKRLIEAERRIARIESGLQRANRNVVAVQGQIQNSAQNITNPFGSGGGGGTGGIHRFPIEYEMWVEWDTVPTLKTGASLNPTSDVTELAEAVSSLETGFTLDSGDLNDYTNDVLYDTSSSRTANFVLHDFRGIRSYGGNSNDWTCFFKFALFDDGLWIADAKSPSYAGNLLESSIPAETNASEAIRIEMEWPRRNGIGTIVSSDTITARRTLASADDFSYGPTYGDSGTWAFTMECPATTYHNAGSGTLYLRWGGGESFAFSGGSPDDLPADAFDGGDPADLPTDIIDGGEI